MRPKRPSIARTFPLKCSLIATANIQNHTTQSLLAESYKTTAYGLLHNGDGRETKNPKQSVPPWPRHGSEFCLVGWYLAFCWLDVHDAESLDYLRMTCEAEHAISLPDEPFYYCTAVSKRDCHMRGKAPANDAGR